MRRQGFKYFTKSMSMEDVQVKWDVLANLAILALISNLKIKKRKTTTRLQNI